MKIFSQNSAVKETLYLLKARLTNPNWVRQYREVMSHEKWSPEQIHDFNFIKRLGLNQVMLNRNRIGVKFQC